MLAERAPHEERMEQGRGLSRKFEADIADLDSKIAKCQEQLSNATQASEYSGLRQQIEKFEKTDLSKIQNKLVRSKFYEFFADVLMNSNRDGSKEHYLKAIEFSNSDFHLAVLKFKLSKSLFLNNDLDLAEKYIEEARKYRFEDPNINREIDILKGRLNQAKRRL